MTPPPCVRRSQFSDVKQRECEWCSSLESLPPVFQFEGARLRGARLRRRGPERGELEMGGGVFKYKTQRQTPAAFKRSLTRRAGKAAMWRRRAHAGRGVLVSRLASSRVRRVPRRLPPQQFSPTRDAASIGAPACARRRELSFKKKVSFKSVITRANRASDNWTWCAPLGTAGSYLLLLFIPSDCLLLSFNEICCCSAVHFQKLEHCSVINVRAL